MNINQQRVREFHLRMHAPAPYTPTELTQDQINLRLSLIDEELTELADAFEKSDNLEVVDALCDLLYVVYGTAVEMGLDLEPFFAEVHSSNMTKTPGEKRGDGKLLKGPNYRPPDLMGVFARRYPNGSF